MKKPEQVALFILRIGLGLFLLLWGLDKLFSPESTIKVFEIFYFMNIGINAAYVIGVLEVILSVAIIAGYQKKYSYGLGLLAHFISTAASWKQMIAPFGKNHLFIAGLPVLAGFIALYLLRDKDTLYTVRKKG